MIYLNINWKLADKYFGKFAFDKCAVIVKKLAMELLFIVRISFVPPAQGEGGGD